MAMNIKHEFGRIGETFVSFVEKSISKERMEFLKELLEYNGFNVFTEEVGESEDGNKLYNLGVDDTVFNAVIWVYDRKLRTPERKIVNEDYWNQVNQDFAPQYYERKK